MSFFIIPASFTGGSAGEEREEGVEWRNLRVTSSRRLQQAACIYVLVLSREDGERNNIARRFTDTPQPVDPWPTTLLAMWLRPKEERLRPQADAMGLTPETSTPPARDYAAQKWAIIF